MSTPVEWIKVSKSAEEGKRIFPGVVGAGEQVEIGFDAGGRITAIDVDIGDAFSRGQVLASIDNRQQNLRIAEINADISRSFAQLAEANSSLERASKLVESGAISRAEYDAAVSAKRTLSANVVRLKATLGTAQKLLSDTRIYAPYPGRVVRKIANTAQAVSPNQPILEIQSTGQRREVDILVPEELVGQMSRGMDVVVTFSALGGSVVTGKVTRIGAQTLGEAAYPVTVELIAAPNSLINGMTAEVSVKLNNRPETNNIVVPATGIVAGSKNERFVYIVGAESRIAVKRRVTISEMTSEGAVVNEGLKAGDIVVAKGATFLRAGTKVSLIGLDPRRFSE